MNSLTYAMQPGVLYTGKNDTDDDINAHGANASGNSAAI